MPFCAFALVGVGCGAKFVASLCVLPRVLTIECNSGFSFAVNRMFGLILAGVFILIIAIVVFCILGRQWKFLEKKFPPRGPLHSTSTAYQPQPWRDDQAPGGDLGASERPDGYNIPPQQIGLERISSPPPSPSPWKSSEGKKYSDDPDLGDGSVQRPREFA